MTPILFVETEHVILIAGILLIIGMSMRMLARRRRNPGPTAQDFARRQVEKLKEQHNMHGDMHSLMVQLQELSREINAQIDTKFAKLEASIRAADQRIARLEQLGQTGGTSGVDITVSDPPPEQPQPQPQDARTHSDPHRLIYELADTGKNAVQIARETGHSPGEVELILSLRKGLA